MQVLEKHLEARCRIMARALGGRLIKCTVPLWPDRILLMPGKPPVFVEFKKWDGELRVAQAATVILLAEEGFLAAVVKSVPEFREVLYAVDSLPVSAGRSKILVGEEWCRSLVRTRAR